MYISKREDISFRLMIFDFGIFRLIVFVLLHNMKLLKSAETCQNIYSIYTFPDYILLQLMKN